MIRLMTEETFIGCAIMNNFRWKAIDEENSSKKRLIPKFEWHRSMGKESNPHFNNMSMLALCGPILLVRVRARYTMLNTYAFEEGVQRLILPSPVRLDCTNFLIPLTLN